MNDKERIFFIDNEIKSQLISQLSSALFLDRDGVIIEDVGYISKAKDVILEKGIKNLLKFTFVQNVPVFIVTNQSGISRGYYDWHDFDRVNKKMLKLLGKPSPIVAILANSHLSNSEKNWRKPNPEMINFVVNKYNIDTSKSIFIGDRLTDMIAGCKSGINTLVHVKTGHGKKEYENILKYCKKGYFLINQRKSKIIFLKNLLGFPFDIFYEK